METPKASDDDLMPWETDKPTDRSKWGRQKKGAQAPATPAPAPDKQPSGILSEADFALIPQDSDRPVADADSLQQAEKIILEAGKLDSTAVALADLLVGLLEYRDPFFRGGTSQTRLLATAIAKEVGFNEEELQAIALGAVLRDLGQVPLKGLISKPELGAEGRRRVENHVDTALELLAAVNLPQMVKDVIRHHHERWDGAGYPEGLAGDAIPLAARIVAVADSFAAMISARPHRLPRRVPAALEDIKSEAGKQFDPSVVTALGRVLQGSDWRGLRFGLRHHLLIVDPDDSRAMVLATKLCSHGYLAEAAFDLETAYERVKRSKLAAIIVSADMQEAEINKLVREVRETQRVAMLPVIVTDAGVSARVALLEAGADVCLSRGGTFEELKATVEAFLRREGKSAPMQAKSGDAAPWAGLQGDIEDFPLAWLLQVLNYDARTAAIFLRGEGDDGRAPLRPFGASYRGRRLVAVHLRHLHVHQHEPVARALNGPDRLAPVRDEVGRVTEAQEVLADDLADDRVVLRDQHARATFRLRGAGGPAPRSLAATRRRRAAARRFARQGRFQTRSQLRLLERLEEDFGRAPASRPPRVVARREVGHQDDARARRLRAVAYLARRLARARDRRIEEDEVVRLAVGRRVAQRFERPFAAVRAARAPAPRPYLPA